jgi:hemolysin activation/secretion protein
VKYSDSTGTKPDTVLAQEQPIGSGKFGQVGIQTLFTYNSRLDKDVFAGGINLDAVGSYYPELWDVKSDFGSISGSFSGYVPLSDSVIVNARVGGKKVWGDAPFFEGAYIGGARTLYGYSWNRFVGDASLHGLAGLRWAFKEVRAGLPGDLGLLVGADIARVFLKGESSSRWHPSYAAGIFYAPFERHFVFDVGVGRSSEGTFFLIQAKMLGLGLLE